MTFDGESDEALAVLVQTAGDQRAFAELVRRHQSLVRAMLSRLMRGASGADDLAQETFVRAYRKIADYSGSGSFKAWLCRIAYTEFLMAARKDRARKRTAEAFGREPGEDVQAPGPQGASLDLDRALASLKPEERSCVVLCYANGLSHGEAAEVTGLALGTVKSHVNRGRAKLRAWFEAKEEAA